MFLDKEFIKSKIGISRENNVSNNRIIFNLNLVNIPQHLSSIKIAPMLVSVDDIICLAFPKRF